MKGYKVKIFKVYIISSDKSNYYYIGKTDGIKGRWQMHLYDSNKKETFIANWLKKHKNEAKMTVLEDNLTEPESFYFEKWYIELFKMWGLKLMNHTLGGEGVSGYHHTLKSKSIISKTHMNKTYSEESKNKMRDAKLKEKHFQYNKPLSTNTKQKMSISSIKINRKVKAYNLLGEFVGEFDNATNVKNTLLKNIKLTTGDILAVCNYKQKTSNGYIFQFSDNNKIEELLVNLKNNQKINQLPVLQYDLENNFIKEWPSSTQIEKEYKLLGQRFNSCDIRFCCRGKQKTAFGYKWKWGNKDLLNKYDLLNKKELGEIINTYDSNKKEQELNKILKNKVLETNIYNLLKELYTGEIILNFNNDINFYLPEKKLGFNICNLKENTKLKIDHNSKLFNKYKNEIKLIQIFSDELINKENIVKSRIINELGLLINKIYARKCIIKEVDAKIKNTFLNQNHIQGEDRSEFKYGLYYNEELVSIMTFRKPRTAIGNKKSIPREGNYELIRFCNKINTTVVGGASKLLNAFIKKINPKIIYSFADNRWSSPIKNLYLSIGFKFISSSKHGYWYTKNFNNRLHRFNFNRGALIKRGHNMENTTEAKMMESLNYHKINDCGVSRYEISFLN